MDIELNLNEISYDLETVEYGVTSTGCCKDKKTLKLL